MGQNSNMLKAAHWYLSKGFSVIPVKQDKRPLLPWEKYQKEQPTKSDLDAWWQKWPDANLAIVTGEVSDLTVVDIDSMEAKERIYSVLPMDEQTPACSTPGGGEHRYYRYQEGLGNSVRWIEGADIRSQGGYVVAPPSCDSRGAYEWYAENSISKVGISPLSSSLLSLINKYINTSYARAREGQPGNGGEQKVTGGNIMFEKGGRDNALFHLANHLAKSGMPEGEIQQYLLFVAAHCSPPFPERDALVKVQSAIKRVTSGNKNISEEVREYIQEVTRGHIKVTDVSQQVTGGNKAKYKAVLMALNRCVKDGIIERTDRAGEYRIVEKTFEPIKLTELVEEPPIEFKLPFFLEHYVRISSKDLVVIAGTPNAGKTAVMLNLVKMNMRKYKCFYFSSEMSAQACRRRWKKIDPPEPPNFEFVEEFPNFVDIIQPDDVNFIDYLEETEGEAFKIPGMLAKIQRRLRKGVAVVALQKFTGRDWAVGGQQTTAKPAVFCTIEQSYPSNVMKVVKAKEFVDINPNGFVCRFKIVSGINLRMEDSWNLP